MKRRSAVRATLGLAGAVVLGCSDDTTAPGGGGAGAGASGAGGPGGTGPGGEGPGGGSNGGGGSGAGGQGGLGGEGGSGGTLVPSCTGDSGMTPAELLAPIDTIVVLMMENRSFDHYLGSLKLAEGRMDVNGLDGTESNPAPDGSTVTVFNLTDFTPADPPHGWDAAHQQFDNGLNDGFVIAHEGPDQNDVMGYHLRDQIPITYALADGSALCHRWHASVMGPTWPNRFYLHGATSNGRKDNAPVTGFTSIFDLLDDAGVTNKNYYHDAPWATGAYLKFGGVAGIEQFFEAAAAGTLPQFSIIDPQFFGNGANDDHPDHDIQLGQALISSVYSALAQSPQWSTCLFILIYDEHGGFFDHVPPPMTSDYDDEFTQMGFRVPAIVSGPFVKTGCVVDTTLEHVSVIKTLTIKYGLDPLNIRVTAANDLSSCIEPAYFSDPQPPVVLPVVNVSISALEARTPSNHHPEIWEATNHIPRHLDRRDDSMGITRRVLEWGRRLGAVRLIP